MNIWTGLLFLEGAVADPVLARELAGEAPSPESRREVATAGASLRAPNPLSNAPRATGAGS